MWRNLFIATHDKQVKRLCGYLADRDYLAANKTCAALIRTVHAAIPEEKRISCGIHSVIREIGMRIFQEGTRIYFDVYPLAKAWFESQAGATRSQAVAVQIMALWMANEKTQWRDALPYIERAACSEDWELREHVSGFFRKVIQAHKREMQLYLRKLAQSPDARLRRFVSETLRPVADGKWIMKNPGYSLAVLEKMFQEHDPYPRTSVGNNLSDLSRANQEQVFGLVEALAGTANPDAYWIAYRACRNLVKKDPGRVMQLLGVERYQYKDRNYFKA